MISVIVPTYNAQQSLTRCFDSLIAATVQGLVREVIVADGGSTDGTLAIADAAGAHVVNAPHGLGAQFAAGARIARSDWLLFLQPQTALEASWEAEVESFMARTTLEQPMAAVFRYGRDDFGPAARRSEMLAGLRCWLLGLPRGNQSLLIPQRLYTKLGGHRVTTLEDIDLARRIGAGRIVRLRARAINKSDPRHNESAARQRLLLLLHALRLPTSMLARLAG